MDQEDLFHQTTSDGFFVFLLQFWPPVKLATSHINKRYPCGSGVFYTARRLLGFHFADKRRLLITLNPCQAHTISRPKVTLANQAYKSQSHITEVFPSEGNRNSLISRQNLDIRLAVATLDQSKSFPINPLEFLLKVREINYLILFKTHNLALTIARSTFQSGLLKSFICKRLKIS